jgi:hypothetical protein
MSLVLGVEILGEYKNLTAATKGAQSQLSQLNQRASKISAGMNKAFAAIGIGFSLRIITQQLEEATKAAVDDTKSQTLLANQMRNTTNATDSQIRSVEKQINALQLSASVADDELRPAYATLLRSTKSSAEAMKLLTLATDVSAGSGKGLTSVTMALSKAYQGKMAALTKLGIPMSDSIQNASDYAREMTKLNKLQNEAVGLTGKDYVEAMQKVADQQDKVNRIAADGVDWQADLTKAFQGSADAAADTDPYQRMQVIFGEIQEQIGMVLLPTLNEFAEWLATPHGQKTLQELVDLVKTVLTAFVTLGKWISENKDWLVPMVIAIGTVTTAFNIATAAARAFQAAATLGLSAGALGAGGVVAGVGAGAAIGGFMEGQQRGQTAQIYGQGFKQLGSKTLGKNSPTVNVNVKNVTDAKTIINEVKRFTNSSGTSLGRALIQ